MKNTDIALIILVAAISVVASYLLGNAILGDPNDRVETLSYMDPISNSIEQPDIETFNATAALNPTVEVYVGNCGPLEDWNEAKHTCVPKAGFENKDNNNDEDEDEESSEEDENVDGSDAFAGVE
ncbi:MAG: hypothetical protein MJ154_01710 [Candidatus Saccharibacteria bacterium]|nr:hypothetical protein [Candidatus Saccharibacteria bacterium]